MVRCNSVDSAANRIIVGREFRTVERSDEDLRNCVIDSWRFGRAPGFN